MEITQGEVCYFRHSGDFDGDVMIQEKEIGGTFVRVPFADLRILVTAWARHTRTAIIENAADQIESLAEDLLG